jgi:flavorubredoxin
VLYEAEKYYCNILNPFSPMVKRKVAEILDMNLPIKMIAPSHGIIWRENPALIIEKYQKWCDAYQEDQITIVYDTMWQSTRQMAQAIAQGIREESPSTTVKLFNASKEDKNDILTEMFRSKAVLVGSPTINTGYSYAIAGILEMARGLKFKNKKAAAFGSYGWSGDAPKLISKHLEEAGFEIACEEIRKLWVPDDADFKDCVEYGRRFTGNVEPKVTDRVDAVGEAGASE